MRISTATAWQSSGNNQVHLVAKSSLSQSLPCGVEASSQHRSRAARRDKQWRIVMSLKALGIVAWGLAVACHAPEALAQAGDGHTIVSPGDIKWSPGPPSIPAGAQAAVLYGDPGKDGMFALRLKLPKGYVLAPHTHPKPEVVTVISGTFRLGMGEAADRSKAQPLAAGSFLALHPGMAHFAFADEDTVIQLNSTGPWTLTYVNPNDDPRKKTQ
jgi:quercetin dioxygenase-like cupin family protein